jgi:hypothetical protein
LIDVCQKFNQILEQIISTNISKYGSICLSCKYCKSIDVHGEVDCEIFVKTTLKVYCRGYIPKEVEKK